jgi:Zinc finger, C3HC4 type (RING finger)
MADDERVPIVPHNDRDNELGAERPLQGNEIFINTDEVEFRPNQWLLTQNTLQHKMNISVILSASVEVSIYLSLYFYLTAKNPSVVLVPVFTEIFCGLVATTFYWAYPRTFQIPSDQLTSTLVLEVLRLVAKIGLVLSLPKLVITPTVGTGWIVFSLLLFLMLTFCKDQAKTAYSSMFRLGTGFYMVPITLWVLKISSLSSFSWTTIFLWHKIIGWLLFIAACVMSLAIIAALIVLISAGRRSFIVLMYVVTTGITVWTSALVIICCLRIVDVNSMSWISISYPALLMWAAVWSVISMGFFLAFGDQRLEELTKPPDNSVQETTGLNYALNLIQASPTFFVSPTEAVRQVSTGEAPASQNEPQTCEICCERAPNCVIFNCMHGGFCKECAVETLKKSPNCPFCRKPVVKVAVIHKESESKYIVTDEITII